jgi:type VI secretion system protein ImpA
MPTPPLIDLEALTVPIPGPDSAGKPVPFAVREQLEAARKEVDPRMFDASDPLRPAEEQRADWPLVVRLTTETLSKTSKDLLVAARLTEALTKRHGFAGVRDGLGLLRRLIEGCWDRLLPPIEEEDDIEIRAAAFFWLNDQDRGARFPHSLRAVPMVVDGETCYGWRQWKEAQRAPVDDYDQAPSQLKAGFEKAVLATPRQNCQDCADDLKAALGELDALDRALDAAMGRHAPGLSGIREALGQCAVLADQVLAQKGPGPAVTAAAPAASLPPVPVAVGPSMPSAPPVPHRLATNRAQLYQQIAETAAALKQLEPHSPIPYLLQRAVELGALPFPELMKVLVRNPEVLDMMNRELGISQDPSE